MEEEVQDELIEEEGEEGTEEDDQDEEYDNPEGAEGEPPRMYNRISDSDRRRIIGAFERGEDFVALARQLNIKRTTAYTIVRSGRVEKLPKGGAKRIKWDAEMQEFICAQVEANPLITLKQLNSLLRQNLPTKPVVTDKTVSAKLNGALYTTKLARDLPAGRNSPPVIQQRVDFCEWICSADVVAVHKVFIDEFGFDTWMRRSQGRSQRGERVYRQVGSQKGLRVTVCVAVCPAVGIVHYQTYDRGMTKERFGEFLHITIGNFQAEYPGSQCHIVIDNVSSHNDAEDYEVPDSVTIRRLPPYSPFLTPVENAISCWKAAVKRELAAHQQLFIAPTAEQLGGRTMTAHRKETLVAMVQQTAHCVTADKCNAWFNHIFTYVPRCLARQAIDG